MKTDTVEDISFLLYLAPVVFYGVHTVLDLMVVGLTFQESFLSVTRNPIYISFVGFQISMFLLFGNLMYLLSSILLFLWIHFFVVLREESYLSNKFGQEYEKYRRNVPRWILF